MGEYQFKEFLESDLDEMTDRQILKEIACTLHGEYQETKELCLGLKRLIVGNGEVGLLERHNTLASSVGLIKKVLVAVGGAIGVLILGFLWKIFTGEIKIQ